MSRNVPDRLAAILARLDAADASQPDRQRSILRNRARLAAAAREEIREPEGRLVAFRAAGELFGVPLHSVVAITIIRAMTPLPGVAPALAGLLNVRGHHVTAIDLGLFVLGLNEAARRLGDASKAITIAFGDREIALISDELLGIREIFAGDLRELRGASASAVVHQTAVDGLHVLDVSRLFADPRLATRTAQPGSAPVPPPSKKGRRG